MLYRYYSFRSSYGQAKIVCFCLPFFSSLLFCMYVCVYPVCFVCMHALAFYLFSISFTILFCNALLFLLFWMEWEITSCVCCVCLCVNIISLRAKIIQIFFVLFSSKKIIKCFCFFRNGSTSCHFSHWQQHPCWC